MKKIYKIKFFTKNKGFSKGIYKSLNCGLRSKDDPFIVKKNIVKATSEISKQKKMLILPQQSHTNKCLIVKKSLKNYQCDGLVTNDSDIILGVTTADCLPIIFVDQKSRVVGICHAGWRGLLNGIIENTLMKMIKLNSKKSKIHAFIGPCIRKKSYEVSEVFINDLKPKYCNFSYKNKGRFYYDLPKLAKFILKEANISKIHDTKKNTFVDNNYFSYRESRKRNFSDYGRNISMVTLNRI